MAHEFRCCICGQKASGWGNNPWPVKESGECCLACDLTVVVPARIKLSENQKTKSNEDNATENRAMVS